MVLRKDRIIACLVVVAVHVMLWRMLEQIPTPPEDENGDSAITVVWVAPPQSRTDPHVRTATLPKPRENTASAPARPRHSQNIDPAQSALTVIDVPPHPPRAAELAAQAHAWVVANEPVTIPPPDPLRDHVPGRFQQRPIRWPPPPPPPTLDGIDRGRRMVREADYLADFCPKMEALASESRQQGDEQTLQRALAQLQAYCR